MFIQIKHEKKEYEEYINIFKIISIKPFDEISGYEDVDIAHNKTAISYGEYGSTCLAISYEPVKDFMKRLKKETRKAVKGIENRFEIMDL